MLQLGLIGYPVGHSLSPWIHNRLLAQSGLEGEYQLLEIKPENFHQEIQKLKKSSLNGFNITIPYKEKILPYLDETDEAANHLGAVNTVKVENGRWIGYNTDGIGYVHSIKNRFPDLSFPDTRVLILGSGGAARGIFFALADAGCLKIDLANRTVDKAAALIEELNLKVKSSALNLEDAALQLANYDFVVQTTSVGMNPDTDAQIISLDNLKENVIVSDIVYRPMETQFLLEAERKKARLHFGHEMLWQQAVYSFQVWTNKKLETSQMMQEFEDKLKGVHHAD
ncbi:shikimate dehydrogenase [Halobacillus rhizosphaerae]|uniref:shikimate dehydrogenase n=1 Tax=Halobacillus rhizosphaerae TaxID=3064889 RepID=UPI00398B9FB3